MNSKDIEVLTSNLESLNSKKGKIASKRIDRIENQPYSNYKRNKRMQHKVDKQLSTLFFKSIDPKSVERIKQLKNAINQIENAIYRKTGWWFTYSGAMKTCNYELSKDPEMATHDTFSLCRDDNGFYVYQEKPFNSYDEYIQENEKRFYNSYKNQLAKLHELMVELETIMRGNYQIINPAMTPETMRMISEYLGYSHSPLNPRKNYTTVMSDKKDIRSR